MGCLYKRKQKLPTGEYRELPTWWIKYYQGGRAVRESTGSAKSPQVVGGVGAGDGDRTRDIELGKLAFYR